jgi:hypothetical protein
VIAGAGCVSVFPVPEAEPTAAPKPVGDPPPNATAPAAVEEMSVAASVSEDDGATPTMIPSNATADDDVVNVSPPVEANNPITPLESAGTASVALKSPVDGDNATTPSGDTIAPTDSICTGPDGAEVTDPDPNCDCAPNARGLEITTGSDEPAGVPA